MGWRFALVFWRCVAGQHQRHPRITIHSSRSHFVARLNSGVMRQCVVVVAASSFGCSVAAFRVGSGL